MEMPIEVQGRLNTVPKAIASSEMGLAKCGMFSNGGVDNIAVIIVKAK